ncbi:tRNA pseudouridine32 synthase/23S rRNA pseudouridine746 synthase [Acinetobacter calcoaceticus]|uniref:tRNA pseudouridine32 synthase/23S rRNA pseudouridine746 synthase n=1 Tax=Acinetobacter calcoaceticus TaxID=471 RepID=A0A4R1XNE0_ACICA|nr:tRNA pseudouridine32 synthase/23S rRNA pseudouridine746 synthase [Acinetobacter calcoaceticus]
MQPSPAEPPFLPPMRDGVSASQVFLPRLNLPISTVFAYLCQHFPHIDAAEWRQRFDDQLVFDQHGHVLSISSGYQAEQHIYYYRFLAHEIHVPFYEQILFETDDLLVVDKPHFLTMSPTGQYVQETLLVRLKKTTGNPDLTPIHRLDRETAGVVLISKRVQTRGAYQQMFAREQVHKTYHAIAPYRPELEVPRLIELRMEKSDPFYTMRVVEGLANTRTEISMLEHHDGWAKYCLKPHTGKQHQLRVHLSHLQIPIRYDPFYPEIQHKANDDFSKPLQLLAKHITFHDPLSDSAMHFQSGFDLAL